jgi:hypothetical protein
MLYNHPGTGVHRCQVKSNLMKKKINLTDLKVKSFITEVDKAAVKGGADDKTRYFITCGFLECVLTTEGNRCTTNTVI